MTTIVSVATQECIVMGCDSLSTDTQRFIHPIDFFTNFFDCHIRDLQIGFEVIRSPVSEPYERKINVFYHSTSFPFVHSIFFSRNFF